MKKKKKNLVYHNSVKPHSYILNEIKMRLMLIDLKTYIKGLFFFR